MSQFFPHHGEENTVHVCTQDQTFYKHVLLVWYKYNASNGSTTTVLLEFGPKTHDGAAFISLRKEKSYVNIFEFTGFVNVNDLGRHLGRQLVSVANARCIAGIWFPDQLNLQEWAKSLNDNDYQAMVNDCRHFANNVYHKLTGKTFDIDTDQPWTAQMALRWFGVFGPFE